MNQPSDKKEILQAKLKHVETFLRNASEYADNYFFNINNPSAQIYQNLIKDLESKLAIEEAVNKYSKVS